MSSLVVCEAILSGCILTRAGSVTVSYGRAQFWLQQGNVNRIAFGRSLGRFKRYLNYHQMVKDYDAQCAVNESRNRLKANFSHIDRCFPEDRSVGNLIKKYLLYILSRNINPSEDDNHDKFLEFITDPFQRRKILKGVDEKALQRINEHFSVRLQGLDRSSFSQLRDKLGSDSQIHLSGKALKQRFGRGLNVLRKFFVFNLLHA